MTDYPYEGEVQLLGYAWNPDDGNWARVRFHSDTEDNPHPFKGLPRGRENGQRFRMRFDLIADDETTTGAPAEPAGEVPEGTPEQPGAEPTPAPLKGGVRAKRTGILRNDPAFQNWYQGELPAGVDRAEYTARTIRVECNVGSCAELDHNEEAGRIWDALERDWRAYSDGRTDPDLEAQRDRRPG